MKMSNANTELRCGDLMENQINEKNINRLRSETG